MIDRNSRLSEALSGAFEALFLVIMWLGWIGKSVRGVKQVQILGNA